MAVNSSMSLDWRLPTMAMTARLSVALSLSLSVMPPSTATGTDVEPLMVNSGFPALGVTTGA